MVTRIIEDWARDHRIAFAHGFGRDADDFLSSHDRAVYVVWERPRVGVTEVSMRFKGVTQEEREDLNMRLRRSGAVVEGQRVRVKIRRPYGQAGGVTPSPAPAADPTWLYFTMPEGGIVTLTKNGTPTAVTLEYSLDNGTTWTEWTESGNVRTMTLNAGQTMHVRNTSPTSTKFSTSSGSYYTFNSSAICNAGGNVMSLLCQNPENANLTSWCFYNLFNNFYHLLTAPLFPATTLAMRCYAATFRNCYDLSEAPILPAVTSVDNCYRTMLDGCSSLEKITILLEDATADSCLTDWVIGVHATGDFYCPSSLTIPTGTSGIPSGWTRHDI